MVVLLLVMRLFAHSLETPSGLIDSFSPESFVNKESMCNFAARFNRNIFLTINILIERK
jgi:hypothetical protein